MFLDSDDFFKKIKVQKIVNAFEKSKDYQIIFDKPFIFFSKKNFYKKKNYKNSSRKYLWPKFPPQSCITIKRNFFKIILNEIKKKEFSLLTLDFRLAVLSCFAYNNFIILDEYLTYYFQDKKGETNFKFKKFNINWWVRRKQAHDYVKYIHQKYKKDHSLGLDYFVTNFIVLFIKLFGFK